MDALLNFEKVDELVGQLKQVATEAFRDGQAIDKTERAFYSRLMMLGKELVGAVIAAAGDSDLGPSVEKNGRLYRRLPKRPRRYRSIFGDFNFERVVYGTSPSEAIQAIPLDEHLGLPEHDYSLILESWTGMLATESSFHRAVERLDSIFGIHVPLDSSERIEIRLGKSAALVLDNMPLVNRATEAAILVQTSDNKGIPMVRPPAPTEPVGAPSDRKGPVPDRKQMACMAGVYTVPANIRTRQEIIDALFRVPKTTKAERIDVAPRNPRYFASMTRYDSRGNVIGKTAEEQAQQWMTANTIRRHAQNHRSHPTPDHIRSDNGPEFIAKAIQQWLKQLNVKTLYVEPGSPWENGYAESFHSRVRDELLNVEEFSNLAHARACGSAWREDYNDYRPHSSLGGLPPSEFARRCAASVSAKPQRKQHSEPFPVTQPSLA